MIIITITIIIIHFYHYYYYYYYYHYYDCHYYYYHRRTGPFPFGGHNNFCPNAFLSHIGGEEENTFWSDCV